MGAEARLPGGGLVIADLWTEIEGNGDGSYRVAMFRDGEKVDGMRRAGPLGMAMAIGETWLRANFGRAT